jgi:hypothetical protein
MRPRRPCRLSRRTIMDFEAGERAFEVSCRKQHGPATYICRHSHSKRVRNRAGVYGESPAEGWGIAPLKD